MDISATLGKKIELVEIYRSENGRTGGLWLDYLRANARMMGLKTGVQYAEGFEVVKWRL